MNTLNAVHSIVKTLLLTAGATVLLPGCSPTFQELRLEGQQLMQEHKYAAAETVFMQADQRRPGEVENIYDLGQATLMKSRRNYEFGNRPAALRDVERSIGYFDRAIAFDPGFQRAIVGKNRAMELKGQYEEALDTAKWAATYVGPSANQYLFYGAEYEERGDLDGALLRYQQALALDPDNASIYKAIGLLQERAGNRDEAVIAYEESLQLDRAQPDIARRLAALHGSDTR